MVKPLQNFFGPLSKERFWVVGLLLAGVTSLLYWQVRSHEFVNYDDNSYVYENTNVQGGFNRASLIWAFTPGQSVNWHPLTWLSHMLDFSLFGLNAGGHHLVNVLFHILNSLLLFQLMKKMGVEFWTSAVVAMFFAWHPLHVESVAWVAERKDVLSGLFFMLTLLSYMRYSDSPGIGSYSLTLLFFALGLMSKPMLVTLPFVLLLLDFWPLKRWRLVPLDGPQITSPVSTGKLFVEKIPFFVLSLASSCVTYAVQNRAGATRTLGASLGLRATNSVIAYTRYLGKLFWPSDLAVFYPFDESPRPWKLVLAAILLCIISVGVVAMVRRMPFLLVGWLWFLGTLVPVIGIVQVGRQSMADRYTYIPSIGIFMAVAMLAHGIILRKPETKLIAGLLAASALAACAAVTWRQADYWQDSVTLFRHALAVTSSNSIANFELGEALNQRGEIDGAIACYRAGVSFQPDYPAGYVNLGVCLGKKGNYREAVEQYEKQLAINPKDFFADYNYGVALEAMTNFSAAAARYRQAMQLSPDFMEPRLALASLLLKQGLGGDAKKELQSAARLKPDNSEIHSRLGGCLGTLGDSAGAANEYETAIRLDANNLVALNNLAWLRAASPDAALRNGAEAVRLAEKACAISGEKEPLFIGTLAAAYAEAGRFQEAAAAAGKARDLALAAGQKETADANERLLKLYESGRACHEEPRSAAPANR